MTVNPVAVIEADAEDVREKIKVIFVLCLLPTQGNLFESVLNCKEISQLNVITALM